LRQAVFENREGAFSATSQLDDMTASIPAGRDDDSDSREVR
jgi:hypothetical protein